MGYRRLSILLLTSLAFTGVVETRTWGGSSLPPPEYRIVTQTYDHSTNRGQAVYQIEHYVGGGIEPMVVLTGSVTGGDWQYDTLDVSFGTLLSVNHSITFADGAVAPDGWDPDTLIPFTFSVRAEGSVQGDASGWISNIYAGVAGFGGYVTSQTDHFRSVSVDAGFSGWARAYTNVTASAGADMYLSGTVDRQDPGIRYGSEGIITVDPFLQIDPTFEYADLFVVRQWDENPNSPTYHQWVEVNRDWETPVPVPSSLLLLGSGLAGLVGFVRRKRG